MANQVSFRNMFVHLHISSSFYHNTLCVCIYRWQTVLVGAAQRTTMMCMPGRQASPAACPAFTTASGENQFPDSLLLLYDLTLVPSWFIQWIRTKADPSPLDNNEEVQMMCEKHWDECAFGQNELQCFLWFVFCYVCFSKFFQGSSQLKLPKTNSFVSCHYEKNTLGFLAAYQTRYYIGRYCNTSESGILIK